MSRTAVFTIVSKNYWGFARVLMRSLERHQPGWERHVVLVDEPDESVASERFGTIPVTSLSLPRMREFFFRYSILELNTAVKPWAFEYLFERGYDRVVYLDPDTCLYSPLVELEEVVESAFLVLTPHLTGMLDQARPTELDIIRAGIFNLGFLAVTRRPPLHRFLRWWQEKLEFDCVVDSPNHIFVDQKWLDLAPGLFPDVAIFRDESYNVAYWNLAHRRVVRSPDGEYGVNGRPLRFFHFSGIDVFHPGRLSKYQNRFREESLGDCLHLLREYARRALDAGHAGYHELRYAYGYFADGARIGDFMRGAYRRYADIRALLGPDPFASSAPFNGPMRGDDRSSCPMTLAMGLLWEVRPDLRAEFPDPWGDNWNHYARWFVANASTYTDVDPCFQEPARRWLESNRR
jgi:hypothetical protein